VRNVKRGDFFVVRNPNGSVRCVVYAPQGQLKRDRGHTTGATQARVFKRPVALPCPGEPKLSFDIILDTMFSHLDKLPWTGDRSQQPMFYQLLQNTPAPGTCFFVDRQMGWNSFDSLLRTAIWSCGLKVSDLQYQNQALRPTAFGFHRMLGLSTGLLLDMRAGRPTSYTVARI
jgi:hypothetical protein